MRRPTMGTYPHRYPKIAARHSAKRIDAAVGSSVFASFTVVATTVAGGATSRHGRLPAGWRAVVGQRRLAPRRTRPAHLG